MRTAVVWFRRDLRLDDNPALRAALAAHDQILPVFIHAPDEEAPWAMGEAQCVWLEKSLESLTRSLRNRGSDLLIRRGPTLETLLQLIADTGASGVYWNRLYEPALIARDRNIKTALRQQGFAAHSFNGALLLEPWEISNLSGRPYRMFTPFWRAASQRPVHEALAAPASVATVNPRPESLAVSPFELHSGKSWTRRILRSWHPGEPGAARALRTFVKTRLTHYADTRDFPAIDGISRLSPHLHFGEITPRQIHEAVRNERMPETANQEAFIRQLYWREFAHHLLYHFPETPQEPLNRRFIDFPWSTGETSAFKAWREGRTGIPLVDAGMRELWNTGFMHNRIRMITASFLVKNLGVHWSQGARWFWETLLDADLANNTLGWQWIAGTGADAAPYHRIFNPLRQGDRFDAQGAYIRRHVPELQSLPDRWIQCPWRAPIEERCKTYPEPIVDLEASRKRALSAYGSMNKQHS